MVLYCMCIGQVDKECLYVGLSNAAAFNYGEEFVKNLNAVTICQGPNIANFSKTVSLQTMVDHIYGRTNIMTNPQRSNMFIAELHLYINYLKEQLIEVIAPDQNLKRKKYCAAFYQNMMKGISYYRTEPAIAFTNRETFDKDLYFCETELDSLNYQYAINNNATEEA